MERRGRGRALRGSIVVLVPALAAGLAVLALTAPDGSRPAVGSVASAGVGFGSDAIAAAVIGGDSQQAVDRGRSDDRRPAPPALLRVRSADVAVAVDPVRAHRNEIEVPPVERVGWLRGGPRPGEPGRTVLIGHRDSTTGPAPFAALATLERGARVEIVDGRGQVRHYRVGTVEQVPKSEFPASDVYAHTGRSTLALITCEGEFKQASGYEDNLIVYARPTS